MKLRSHGRFDYSPITDRPDFEWPGGRRLALYVAVCIEHFPYNESGLGLSYSPGLPHPNTYNWGWREYGNRVGGFRLLEAMTEYGVAPTALVNAACYEHCPQLLQAYAAASGEMVAHGITNSVHPNERDAEGQREEVRAVYETMSEGDGRPPAGWMSPGANPGEQTEDLLAEHGFRYTLDWPIDQQPVWLRTDGGSLLAVPYPHEVNDVPMIVFHHGSSRDFADMVIDEVDEMLDQSADQALVCGITVHTFIAGQPFRLRQFRRALERIAALEDRIWITTAGAVADHYASLFPPPEPGPGWQGHGAAGAPAGPGGG